jgi:ATP-binding cassette, subfamily C (CFTR/MRP), member 1
LARALYSGKEFVVLDDVFSALDANTEQKILNNLWGTQGLIQTGNLTIILASSNGKQASHLP